MSFFKLCFIRGETAAETEKREREREGETEGKRENGCVREERQTKERGEVRSETLTRWQTDKRGKKQGHDKRERVKEKIVYEAKCVINDA